MKKCEKCNKTILSGRICKNCYHKLELSIRTAPATQKLYMDQFAQENMLIGYYTNIIDSYIMVLEYMYKDLEYLPVYKDQIEPNNFEDAKKIYKNKLRLKVEKIKRDKIKPFEKTGEVKYLTAIVGLEEDIKDTLKIFPQYKEELRYDDLEKIINM